MLVVISDACVLIDIECSELTNAVFSLPYRFMTPDTLFAEELEKNHSRLVEFGLINEVMSEVLVAEIVALSKEYRRPSRHDLSALVLARHKMAILLTGDKALREVAGYFNIEVHGTIWLVEQLIQQDKITVDVATIAFGKMKKSGSHLPWGEVEKMLQIYRLQECSLT